MLRIVTDGAADMPPAWKEDYDIQVLPIRIQFGEKTYVQGVDIDIPSFYRIVEETGIIPKTSQPSPHQFVEFYERIAQAGDTILSMHVTQKLSGTFDSACKAAKMLAGKFRILPFDSASGSTALGMMCREARIMDRSGANVERILERMEEIRSNVQIIFAMDTLRFARMSGRVKAIQSALASVLRLKPIAALQDGMLYMVDKVRTRRASLEKLLTLLKERMGDQRLNIAIVHANDLETAKSIFAQAQERFNIETIVLTDLAISLAVHFGPGTIGVIAYPAEG